MHDSELTERPGKGWTPWATGPGDYEIEKTAGGRTARIGPAGGACEVRTIRRRKDKRKARISEGEQRAV